MQVEHFVAIFIQIVCWYVLYFYIEIYEISHERRHIPLPPFRLYCLIYEFLHSSAADVSPLVSVHSHTQILSVRQIRITNTLPSIHRYLFNVKMNKTNIRLDKQVILEYTTHYSY
jgi:hypothetical protein